METVNANIKFIRKQKGLTQQGFADLIGIKRSSLGAYEEGRAKPNYATIQIIARKFHISIDKLLTEDLAKIADESVFGTRTTQQTVTEVKDIKGEQLRVLSITVDKANRENIELVPEKARAGYMEGYGDPQYIKQLPKFNLPFLTEGTYRAFEIKGDSMLPLPSGSIVVGEYVENWTDVKDGDTYVIVAENDGIVYKRVFNNIDSGKRLTLHSDNTTYAAYTIKVDEIVEVWKAKAFISQELPGAETSLDKLTSLVMDLQQEVIRLQSKMGEA